MNDTFWDQRRRADDQVHRAFLAGLAHAALLGVLGGFVMVSTGFSLGALAGFVYPLLLAVCATATLRHNRLAAALLILLVLWLEGGIWLREGSIFSLLTMILFAPFYFVGFLGAVRWHRLARASRE